MLKPRSVYVWSVRNSSRATWPLVVMGDGSTSPEKVPRIGDSALPAVFNRHEVKLFLHAQVVEGQVDAALGFGDDQPHTVHVVSVLLRIVWW